MAGQVDCVVKIGGSLLAPPHLGDLPRRIEAVIEILDAGRVLLVNGGGPTVDLVREWDRVHGIGEERAHWLAVRGLVFNAHVLESILPRAGLAADIDGCRTLWRRRRLPILDAYRFLREVDERSESPLPRRWACTSDSIAARAAVLLGAPRLLLVKSATIPAGLDPAGAARLGLVDPCFEAAAAPLERIDAVDLRASPAAWTRLRPR